MNNDELRLNDTLFNQRYGDEIRRKALRTPIGSKKQEYEWIVNDPKYITLAITVTFKDLVPIYSGSGMRLATEYEYDKRVLNKVKKCLCRLRKHGDKVLPIPDFRFYEYDQTSFFKGVSNSQTPHHIHGILPIPTHLIARIIDIDTGNLNERLKKDLKSLSKVSTFLIEPLRRENAKAWLHYMLKDKVACDYH